MTAKDISLPVPTSARYRSIEDELPIKGKTYIVCDKTGQNYHLAFWDDEYGFLIQFGALGQEFVMFTELPIYKPKI